MKLLDASKPFHSQIEKETRTVNKGRSKLKIAVIDFETDKFLYGRLPRPFCVEFLSDDNCAVFWGDDCADRLLNYLEQLPDSYMIFAHNGGKFDFWFIHGAVSNPVRVINSRIVSAKLFHHTLRDSLAIIPVPLEAYHKLKIDYDKFERDRRENHKVEILRYLHHDCVDLLTLVAAFVERFTAKLTVGSTAMAQLRKFHEFTRSNETEDMLFRQFYYGGRVEVFRAGVLKGPWIMVDINSSYPKSMRDFMHPVNGAWDILDEIPRDNKRPYFAHFTGTSRGALPIKTETGELSFPWGRREFYACSHEIELARELGLLEIEQVHTVYRAQQAITFGDYIDHFYAEKVAAKKAGDKIGELFAKFMLNSAYGKFGQNPEKYKDWFITHSADEEIWAEQHGYTIESDFAEFSLYAKQAEIRDNSFYDVSIAASITSASRAQLLSGLQVAVDPIYCDTDSLICRSFGGTVSDTELGAWKHERLGENKAFTEAQYAAIAGKKLYALYNRQSDNEPLKIASKGGKLTHKDIIAICDGETIEYENPAPNFSLHGRKPFGSRRFRATGRVVGGTNP